MTSNSGQQPSPPVNNLLQPDIYNRLDAEVIERTRVVNTQLDERLRAQHKMLAKYRLAAERYHRREKEQVKTELSRISARLPAVSRIRDFRSKFLYGEGLRKSSSSPSSLPDQPTPRKIRGVPEDRPEQPFCERYFIHHLPSKKKYYKTFTPSPTPHTGPGQGHTLEECGGGGVGLARLAVSEPPTGDGRDLTSARLANDATEPSVGDSSGGLNSGRENTDQAPSGREKSLVSDTHCVGNLSPGKNDRGGLKESKLSSDNARRTILPPIGEKSSQFARRSPKLLQG